VGELRFSHRREGLGRSIVNLGMGVSDKCSAQIDLRAMARAIFPAYALTTGKSSGTAIRECAKNKEQVMGWMFDSVERLIARLQKPVSHCEPLIPDDEARALRETLRPGDVLLIEGKGRISGGIKYLTQSTWSHSALYVGPIAGATTGGEPHVLIEANIDEGVVSVPLSKYLHCQTRICRPVGLIESDCEQVCRYAVERIGLGYDLKNIIDLMRYLIPCPLTQRWRRRAIALGSGDASRIICSSLIAEAFEAVRYPVLPQITYIENQPTRREVAAIRHSSLYAPRDFDLSPYFMVVKPTLTRSFNYKDMQWADLLQVRAEQATPAPEIERTIAAVA
jgi:hypothetical protein